MTDRWKVIKTKEQHSVQINDDHGYETHLTQKKDGEIVYIDQFGPGGTIQTIQIRYGDLRDMLLELALEKDFGNEI